MDTLYTKNMHYTIGFRRGDGDIEVLATLNNSGEHMTEEEFETVTIAVRAVIETYTGLDDVAVFERQDVPDIVSDEDG